MEQARHLGDTVFSRCVCVAGKRNDLWCGGEAGREILPHAHRARCRHNHASITRAWRRRYQLPPATTSHTTAPRPTRVVQHSVLQGVARSATSVTAPKNRVRHNDSDATARSHQGTTFIRCSSPTTYPRRGGRMEEGEGGRPESSGARRFEATTATGASARVWSRVEAAGREERRGREKATAATATASRRVRERQRRTELPSEFERTLLYVGQHAPIFIGVFARECRSLPASDALSRSIRVEREGAREGGREKE